MLTEHVLGAGGPDDDLSPQGSDTDLHTGVTCEWRDVWSHVCASVCICHEGSRKQIVGGDNLSVASNQKGSHPNMGLA